MASLNNSILGALPKFNGSGVKEFFRSFQRRQKLESWNDIEAIQLCAVLFTGEAERFLNSRPELEELTSFAEFKKQVEIEFYSPPSEAVLHADLVNCKQNRVQNVREYSHELLAKANALQAVSKHLTRDAVKDLSLSLFLQGINVQLIPLMATRDFTSLDEAVKAAEKLEMAQQQVVAAVRTEQLTSSMAEVAISPPNPSPKKCCRGCKDATHTTQNCPKNICFKCGKAGHMKRFCNSQVNMVQSQPIYYPPYPSPMYPSPAYPPPTYPPPAYPPSVYPTPVYPPTGYPPQSSTNRANSSLNRQNF